jgi:hypothetical protein
MGEYVNSKQARFDKRWASCGVLEVHTLSDQPPNATLFAVANHLYHKANGRPTAFVMFSDVVTSGKDSRGLLLAERIKSANIGELWESPKRINPRTGDAIRVWVLAIDHDKFRPWHTEEFANRISED